MRELIRHILKENNLKQELKKVIEDDNIFKAADLVGGMDNLKSIFKGEPEMGSLFEKLTGTITFYCYLSEGNYMKNMKFPLKYEIIGRKSNIHNTNHWPEINVFYDENKLTPEENDNFKSMIKYSIDESNFSDFDAKKFGNYKLFNVNYFTVKELNGENIDLFGGWDDFSNREVEDIHDKLYGDSESLNESTNSEIEKNLKAINVLLSLVSWDGLCDIWVEYNPDDKEYEIRSKTVTSNDLGPSIFEIQEELESLYNSIISMGIRVYIYTPWYVDNCEDEVKFINESEEKQPKYLDIIKDIVEPFKNEDCVCDIRVLYNEEDDMYLIDVEVGLFELREKFYAEVGRNHYVKKIRVDIKEAIKGYIPIDNFYVGSYSTPKCGEKRWWDKNINESDNKEQSLQKLIEQYGLYEFIKMTGLDFNQVKSIINKMDNPKEILKQYIREFVLEHGGSTSEAIGSLFALQIPLSDIKIVQDILVQDSSQIAVEIWGYDIDEYGYKEQNEQYLTTINSLTNEELLSIISWMMETIEEGYWY
jgi:hypothetical protein